MRDIPTPQPSDPPIESGVTRDIESAEDLHRQLAAAIAEAEKTGDFAKAEEIQKLLQEKIEPLKEEMERRDLIFTEIFEGKEIKLDIEETRQLSGKFYQEHDLQEFADNLPERIRLSPESRERIKWALIKGFDRALLLPPAEVQGGLIDDLIEQTATKEYTGLSGGGQYREADINFDAAQTQPQNRPPKAYLLLYQSSEVPLETKDKTPDELKELFKQKKWNSLTVSEYLILQRRELEERQKHSFDTYDKEESKSQWSWLLDSPVQPDRIANACWEPTDKQVVVNHGRADFALILCGARPTVVVEIQ